MKILKFKPLNRYVEISYDPFTGNAHQVNLWLNSSRDIFGSDFFDTIEIVDDGGDDIGRVDSGS